MTSVLNVDTIAAKDGTSAATLTKQHAAKMWSCFNGTGTVATNDSFNQSTLTDNGTGDQTVAFTNSMNNDDYSSTGTCLGGSTDGSNYSIFGAENASAAVTKTSSNVQCTSGFVSNTTAAAEHVNHQEMNLVIHGDLA